MIIKITLRKMYLYHFYIEVAQSKRNSKHKNMSVVVLVYHKLVARDSSKVNKGWKCEYHNDFIDPITRVSLFTQRQSFACSAVRLLSL